MKNKFIPLVAFSASISLCCDFFYSAHRYHCFSRGTDLTPYSRDICQTGYEQMPFIIDSWKDQRYGVFGSTLNIQFLPVPHFIVSEFDIMVHYGKMKLSFPEGVSIKVISSTSIGQINNLTQFTNDQPLVVINADLHYGSLIIQSYKTGDNPS